MKEKPIKPLFTSLALFLKGRRFALRVVLALGNKVFIELPSFGNTKMASR